MTDSQKNGVQTQSGVRNKSKIMGKARAREKGNNEWVECLDEYSKNSWVSFKKHQGKSVLGV